MNVPRQYKYVGPSDIAARVRRDCGGTVIDSVETLKDSLCSMDGFRSGQSLTVTFVVGTDGSLRIADQRSEHVACASGEDILSAGEMTFGIGDHEVFVERVTNQSTGYCPEPESWAAVAGSLDRIPVDHPDSFAPVSVFRRCPSCSQINIVKDEWFVCGVCQSVLPTTWNFE
jgi:hypothetical protein